MENNEMRVEENVTVADTETDYIAAIKELKDNTVSKEDYNKLKNENQKLLKSLVNGETITVEKAAADVGELRKQLYDSDAELSNLEYVTKSLELRDAIIAEGGHDPFLPWGKQIAPTTEDIEAANRVATVLKECVDYAEGDSEVFTNELMRYTLDVAPQRRKRK